MSTLFFSALQRHGKNTAEIKRCLGGGKSGKQVRDYYYRLAKKAREDLVKTRGPENITDELVHHEMHRAWREKCLAGVRQRVPHIDGVACAGDAAVPPRAQANCAASYCSRHSSALGSARARATARRPARAAAARLADTTKQASL
eukprot:scaffold27_cov355-Prasinococcus_capsulatus_cf.AAC.13